MRDLIGRRCHLVILFPEPRASSGWVERNFIGIITSIEGTMITLGSCGEGRVEGNPPYQPGNISNADGICFNSASATFVYVRPF